MAPRTARPIAITAATIVIVAAALAQAPRGVAGVPRADQVQFVFTSDAHYGITRTAFRGGSNVDAQIVNVAMIARINALAAVRFPHDGGLGADSPVGPLDFLVEGGDITNREEDTGTRAIQSSAASWAQFRADYIDGLTVTDRSGRKAPLYIVPGNHEASNAVGFYRRMTPPVDNTGMVEIYNRMMAPAVPRTTTTYDYPKDRVLYARDLGGLHFVFLNVWPDSIARVWMDRDIARVGARTPVIVFAHDQPDAESKHFTNPNGAHDINATDRFENLLTDVFADGSTVETPDLVEQRALERFVLAHPNLTAYFHGNSNWNQFYDWTGPDHSAALHTFRVDSPMKGAVSATDETKLSFHVVTIDTLSRTMTVRERLWNADAWGASTTVALFPRP